jgi:2-hydroxychromene-2-carboxylate isomerase
MVDVRRLAQENLAPANLCGSFGPQPRLSEYMGELIELKDQLADRSRPRGGSSAAFFYDVACPFSYLAAEGIERVLGEVEWIPAPAVGLDGGALWARFEATRALAERRAIAVRLPLVWPDQFPANTRHALRAAAYAAENGAGASFALAATRLAFCGGFDLEDPEILAAAATAAGLPVDGCLAAARDPSRDGPLWATARGLYARGMRRLPAIRLGHRWFEGERVLENVALRGAHTL